MTVPLSSNGRTRDFDSRNVGSSPAGGAIKRGKLRAHRTTRGQVAAVAGLILVGVSYAHAMRIVGTTFQTMQNFLPADWRTKRLTRADNDALRRDYETDRRPIKSIAYNHGLSADAVYAKARAGQWQRVENAMAYRPPISAERIAQIADAYATCKDSRHDIASRYGISVVTLDRFARENHWSRCPAARLHKRGPR